MTRTLTILAAAAALAVSAETASAGTSNKPEQPRTESYTLSNAMISGFSAKPGSAKVTAPLPRRNVDNIDLWVGVKDGSSNTMQFAERRASFTIDIGTSEALRNGTVKQPTRSANLTRVKGGSNGIIAVLIGL